MGTVGRAAAQLLVSLALTVHRPCPLLLPIPHGPAGCGFRVLVHMRCARPDEAHCHPRARIRAHLHARARGACSHGFTGWLTQADTEAGAWTRVRCTLSQDYKLTSEAFDWLVGEVEARFNQARAHAGDGIGSLAAQSLGEPTTQVGGEGGGGALSFQTSLVWLLFYCS